MFKSSFQERSMHYFSKMHAETRPYTTIEANISKLHTFVFVNYVKWIFANMCSRRSLGIKMAEMNVCNIITTWACSFYSFLVSFLGFKVGNRNIVALCKVQFSCSVVSDSLRPCELQHARPPCPSPTPGVQPNSCPSSRWCHPAISSSVVPLSSCPQSLPASESFPMSQLFAWGGQSIRVSALASFLPKNTQDWSPLG